MSQLHPHSAADEARKGRHQTRRSRRPILWAVIGLLAGVVVLVILLATRDGSTSGVPSRSSASPSAQAAPRSLSHVAVEQYIENNLGAASVKCNGGRDFPMLRDGASFTCTAADGHSYTVTVKDKINGSYLVR